MMTPRDEPALDAVASDAEQEELFEELSNKLASIIPQGLFETIRLVRPLEDAISLFLDLGGRIVLDFPKMKLDQPYEIPEEATLINGKQDGFSFKIADTPFIALAAGLKAQKNVDEIVIMSCDLKGKFPLVISKDGKISDGSKIIHVCLLDWNQRCLAIPVIAPVNYCIELSDDLADEFEEIDQAVMDLKEHLEQPVIEPWTDLEEERAIREWAMKNALTVVPFRQFSMDLFH